MLSFFDDRAAHHNDDFALRLDGVEMPEHLRQRAADVLFVNFGNLPRDAAGPVRPEDLDELLESLHQPAGRFVEYHGALLSGKALKQGLAPFFLRQEALEAETVARQAGRNQCGDAGGSTRQSLDFDAFLRAPTGTELKSECLLPTMVGDMIREGKLTVEARTTDEVWFGMTYKEDRASTAEALRKLTDRGVYPEKLY